MRQLLTWTIVVALTCPPARCDGGGCEAELASWIRNASLRTDHRAGDATMRVDWSVLDASLTQAGCPFDELWLELWRVSKAEKPEEETFGTDEYFEKFNRCRRLEDAHFVHHGTARLDRSRKGRQKSDGEIL